MRCITSRVWYLSVRQLPRFLRVWKRIFFSLVKFYWDLLGSNSFLWHTPSGGCSLFHEFLLCTSALLLFSRFSLGTRVLLWVFRDFWLHDTMSGCARIVLVHRGVPSAISVEVVSGVVAIHFLWGELEFPCIYLQKTSLRYSVWGDLWEQWYLVVLVSYFCSIRWNGFVVNAIVFTLDSLSV